MSTSGKIVQVIGAVVDVSFAEENVPNILDAIVVEYQVGEASKELVFRSAAAPRRRGCTCRCHVIHRWLASGHARY